MSAPGRWDADEDEVDNILSQMEDENMMKLKTGGHLYSKPAQGYLPQSSSSHSPDDRNVLGDDLAQRMAKLRGPHGAAKAPALGKGQPSAAAPGEGQPSEDLGSRFAKLRGSHPPQQPTLDELGFRLARLRGGAAIAPTQAPTAQQKPPLRSGSGEGDDEEDLFARMQALRGAPSKPSSVASSSSSSGSGGGGPRWPSRRHTPAGGPVADENDDVDALLAAIKDETRLANPRQRAARPGAQPPSRGAPAGNPATDEDDVATLLASAKKEMQMATRQQREIKSGHDIDEKVVESEADKVVEWALTSTDSPEDDDGPVTGDTNERRRATGHGDSSDSERGDGHNTDTDDESGNDRMAPKARKQKGWRGLFGGAR